MTLPAALAGDGEVVALDRIRRLRASRGPETQVTPVLIASGQRLNRAGIRTLLETQRHIIRVVGEATSGEEAIALVHRKHPAVVLLDERLPGLDYLEVISRIVSESDAAVLLLAESESDDDLFAALGAGATGLLVSDTEPSELVRAVRELSRGGALLSPGLTRRLISELAGRPQAARPSPERFAELTPREREVVALVAHGLDNGQIAERLVVSPATAKTHVSRAMVKLFVHDRAQLVALAYATGLVVPQTGQSRLAAHCAPAPRAAGSVVA